jgi:hypothetical protein
VTVTPTPTETDTETETVTPSIPGSSGVLPGTVVRGPLPSSTGGTAVQDRVVEGPATGVADSTVTRALASTGLPVGVLAALALLGLGGGLTILRATRRRGHA